MEGREISRWSAHARHSAAAAGGKVGEGMVRDLCVGFESGLFRPRGSPASGDPWQPPPRRGGRTLKCYPPAKRQTTSSSRCSRLSHHPRASSPAGEDERQEQNGKRRVRRGPPASATAPRVIALAGEGTRRLRPCEPRASPQHGPTVSAMWVWCASVPPLRTSSPARRRRSRKGDLFPGRGRVVSV